ncbi:MAG: hypothetical protein ACRD1R_13315 [Acidobacteriota bacterium]
MIIDRSNKPWIVASIVIFLVSAVLYIPYSIYAIPAPSGGSWPGLIYAFLGTGMMLFALLLGLRKKYPTLRVGRLHAWMKGHVWLGLLSFPIILFHAGFALGGPLTTVLMVLFGIVVFSGLFGIVLQQYIPGLMTEQISMETIFEQVDDILAQLRQEADAFVQAALSRESEEPFVMEALGGGTESPLARNRYSSDQSELSRGRRVLDDFYQREVRPFLHDQAGPDSRFASEQKSNVVFEQMRKVLPGSFHETLASLADIVEERRQLARQVKLHYLLHGWLFIHVPLSMALMGLAAVHAVIALRY